MKDFSSINEYQEKLSTIVGVSGYEEDIREFIIQEIEKDQLAEKVWTDNLGNVLAIIYGDNQETKILLDAHMDEIGFMVSHIEEKGFLRFVLIGGWDERILLGQTVVIKSNENKMHPGIIGTKPPHLTTSKQRKQKIEISKLYIDLGFFSKQEVLDNGINIGSVGTLYSPYEFFPNNMVRGKAFDDRTGCNVLLHIMKILKTFDKLDETVVFSFSVQEEIGGRGAQPAAYSLEPTMALAIENTTAADVPGVSDSQCPAYLGKGPAITLADKSLISSPKVNKRLMENAKIENIPFQIKKPLYGGTDAGKIHLTKGGVPSSVVSVPCRYIHSPTSLLKLDDILNTIKLVEAFLKNPAKLE
ncbi:MAG: M20/M25/M40 family metallo-hydrolase [Candidatus Lokiarchaeota archaeon]|nr:M20/M25/M40 family metallo-hydrolase [Candidatus Lokiarchaeota archaeon]